MAAEEASSSSSPALIDFDGVGFVGRKKEVDILRTCINRVISTSKSSFFGETPPSTPDADHQGQEEHVSNHHHGPSLVLVSGYSGVGKTSLISEAIKQAQEEQDAVVSSPKQQRILAAFGKFDKLDTAPFRAIDHALQEVCKECTSRHLLLDAIRRKLHEAKLDAEFVDSLTDTFPSTTCFFDNKEVFAENKKNEDTIMTTAQKAASMDDELTSRREDQSDTSDSSGRLNRLKHSFRALVKAICSSCPSGMVLVLDDVQWSDPESLDLVQSLVADTSIQGLIVIASYRDNEVVDKCHLVALGLRHLEWVATTKERGRFSRIKLENHSFKELNCLFADILQMEPKDVMSLSKVVYLKTHGNVFYSLQLLRFLVDNKIVHHCTRWLQWEWIESEVQEQAGVTENVAYLVVRKIRSLSAESQRFLHIASCLGAHFDVNTVLDILNMTLDAEGATMLLDEMDKRRILDELVQQLLILMLPKNDDDTNDAILCRFGHDIIQHAAYSMLSATTNNMQSRVHLLIGRHFWQRCCNREEDDAAASDLTILAAQHLNHGAELLVDDPCELEKLARINLRAAKLSKTLSAFSSSLTFVKCGLDQIHDELLWTTDSLYDLTLQLKVLECELLFCLGQFDECMTVVDEVERQARTVFDKFEVVFVRIQITANRNQLLNAISLGLSLLRDLGEEVPSEPSDARLVYSILVTQKALWGRSPESILELEPMTNESALLVQRTINLLSHYMFYARCFNVMVLTNLRAVRLSLQHGVSKFSPFGFAGYGYVMSVMGNFEDAFRWGNAALELQARFQNDYATRTPVQSVVYNFLYHLRRPVEDAMTSLLNVYTHGMKSGEFQYATQACGHYVQMYLYRGLPLSLLSEDLASFVDHAKQHNQKLSLGPLQNFYQSVLHLQGEGDHPYCLSGVGDDDEKSLSEFAFNHEDYISRYTELTVKLWLSYIFGDYKSASRNAYKSFHKRTLRTRKQDGTGFYASHVAFFVALAGLMEIRCGNSGISSCNGCAFDRRKVRSSVRQSTQFLETWLAGGVAHVEHKVLLLRAETMRTTGMSNNDKGRLTTVTKEDIIVSAYEDAIASSLKSGFISDVAIAAERAAEFYFDIGRLDMAKSRLQLAYSKYFKWEATAKADALFDKYGGLVFEEESVKMGAAGSCCHAPFSVVESTHNSTSGSVVSALTGDDC